MTGRVTIDVVTRRPDGAYTLVLVEEGPWPEESVTERLRVVQDRLYNCVDAAVDGAIAARYPESKGAAVHILLACFNIQHEIVSEFFSRFRAIVASSPEIQRDIAANGNIRSIQLDYEVHDYPFSPEN